MAEPNQQVNSQQVQDSAIVFISYAREDQAFALRLDESLRLKGVNVRGDWQLVRGEDYEEQLRALILDSDSLLFIISLDSARSPACLAEVARAVEQKKPILPVVCRDYDGELPEAVRTPQWTFLRDSDDFVAGVQELIAAANTDFDLMSDHRRLLTAAEIWQRNTRSRSFLLRKEGLRKAVEWLARTGQHPNKLPKPTSLQSEYILASQHSQTRGARIAFGIATGIVLALTILAIVALAQRSLAKQNEGVALSNAQEAERQKKKAVENADEAERQAGIAKNEAAEAERQRNQAEENAREAKRQAGIAKTNEQTARTQQKLAEERRLEAERQRRLAEDKTLEERGARAAILGQRPGREFEALTVALEAVGSDLKNHGGTVPLPAVVEGLDAALRATKYSFPLRGHSTGVNSVAFSRDGSRLLTVDSSGVARLWDTSNGRLVASWKVMSLYYKAPAVDTATTFSSDGKRLVTVSTDKTAVIRDVQTGEPLVTLKPHTDNVYSAMFSFDGTRVVTSSGSRDGTARVWDASNGQQLATTPKHISDGPGGAITIAVFSPDGARLLTAHQDRAARLWDAHTGELLKTLKEAGQGINSAVFLPGGTRVLVGRWLWDTNTGERSAGVKFSGIDSPYTTQVISPDGTKALTVFGPDLYLNDLTGKTKEKPTLLEDSSGRHSADINFAMFSPDGTRIVTASQDMTARLRDTATGKTLMTLEGHADRVSVAAFSPDGKRVVTNFSPDEKRPTPDCAECTAQVWAVDTGKLLLTLEGHTAKVASAAFSPDGKLIVTASADGTAWVWDSASGTHLSSLEGHTGAPTSAMFSPDSKMVLTVGADISELRIDHTARLWDARSGKQLAILLGHTDYINSATFSPDGRYVVTASRDGTAKIYSALESDLLKDYLARAFNLLRFQKEFEGVQRFEPYLIAQPALDKQATRP